MKEERQIGVNFFTVSPMYYQSIAFDLMEWHNFFGKLPINYYFNYNNVMLDNLYIKIPDKQCNYCKKLFIYVSPTGYCSHKHYELMDKECTHIFAYFEVGRKIRFKQFRCIYCEVGFIPMKHHKNLIIKEDEINNYLTQLER